MLNCIFCERDTGLDPMLKLDILSRPSEISNLGVIAYYLATSSSRLEKSMFSRMVDGLDTASILPLETSVARHPRRFLTNA